MLGISAQQLQKYEIGKNKISASRIKHLSDILSIPVDYFLTDPKEPQKDKKNLFNDSATENGVGKLVYYYSMIKSEKVKKLLVQSSAIYVESGL
jgi:transcriptional regulator with XRE-family HTH domain